jgi:SH3-like domain-containing protein
VFTLDGGVPLVGQAYTSQWVRVVTEDGREGWIFQTLVTGRR